MNTVYYLYAMRDQPVSNHNAFAEPGMEGVKKVFAGIRAGGARPQGVRRRRFRIGGRFPRGRSLPLRGSAHRKLPRLPRDGKWHRHASIDIWRVEDGRFVEHWDELNTVDVFIQVGAVPRPRRPSCPREFQWPTKRDQARPVIGAGSDPEDLHGPPRYDELGVRQTKLRSFLMDCSLPYGHGLRHALL